MTMSIVEARGASCEAALKNRDTQLAEERRSPNEATPTGRVEYGNNGVQEIVSGTMPAIYNFQRNVLAKQPCRYRILSVLQEMR